MRISATNNVQSYPVNRYTAMRASTRISKADNSAKPNGISVISFKAGNKGQAIFYGVEVRPYFCTGGVSTVLNDMRALRVSDNSPIIDADYKETREYWQQKDKVFVSPIYNGEDVYNKEQGVVEKTQLGKIPEGLPENSPFKPYEGKTFLTNKKDFKDYTGAKAFFEAYSKKTGKDALKLDRDIFILEDVTGSPKTMSFATNEKLDIKLYRVLKSFDKPDEKGKKELIPTNDFLVYSDVCSTWKAPYEGGGYASGTESLAQTWKGDGDARSAKAFVELTERICEVASTPDNKFDPATIILNDSQAGFATEYMAQKNASGAEFWQGKKPVFIIHNGGAGYIQRTPAMNMFMNIADIDMVKAVEKDPEFIEALKRGPDALDGYFSMKLPDGDYGMNDAQSLFSPYRNSIIYAHEGYVPGVVTVSGGYANALAKDPNLAPGSKAILEKLAEKKVFVGIVNAFEDPRMSPFNQEGVSGYFKKDPKEPPKPGELQADEIYKFPEGYEPFAKGEKGEKVEPYIIKRFVTMDKEKVNAEHMDFDHIREIKHQNKINLLKRFDARVLDSLKRLQDVEGHETDYNFVLAGLPDKKVEVYGHIDSKYYENGAKPKLLVSWGRGDLQKGLDTTLNAFAKYIKEFGNEDKETVLVMGGELKLENIDGKVDKESQRIKEIIDKMNNDPALKGRFVYLNGFAPNKVLAGAGDFSIFPSRFAPCELTDLESGKMLCSPIVTNCQGLADKNFDASFEGEAERVTGYKTKHAYDMTYEELQNILTEKDKEKLETDRKKFYDKIKNEALIKKGQDLKDEDVAAEIIKNSDKHYKYEYEVLRPYRDKVIEDELVKCLEKALKTENGTEVQNTMLKNLLKMETDWEHNNALNADGKSSAQKYREIFQRDAVSVKKDQTLLAKMREKCQTILDKAKKLEESSTKDGDVVKHSKGNKWLLIGASALGVLGLGFGIYSGVKNSKTDSKVAANVDFDDEFDEEDDEEI